MNTSSLRIRSHWNEERRRSSVLYKKITLGSIILIVIGLAVIFGIIQSRVWSKAVWSVPETRNVESTRQWTTEGYLQADAILSLTGG